MSDNSSPFMGVNRLCAQCIHDCKQFGNVVVDNCPNFRSNQLHTPKPGRRERIAQRQNKACEIYGSSNSLSRRRKRP